MKIRLAILAALVLFASSAHATPYDRGTIKHNTFVGAKQTRRCPPKCHHRTLAKPAAPVCAPAPDTVYVVRIEQAAPIQPARPGLWREVLTGFELEGGFLWRREHVCPTCNPRVLCNAPPEPPRVVDPPYLGANLRLPFSPSTGAGVGVRRFWTEAPDFEADVRLYWAPWR